MYTYFWLVAALLYFVGIAFFVIYSERDPLYSVAIDAVSGLEPAAASTTEPTLDPVFDLTLSISPRSRVRGEECYKPFTTVEVAYHDVLLASGPTSQGRAVAWGTSVRLPGFVLDALVDDERRGTGAAVFDVTTKIPSGGNKGMIGETGRRRRRLRAEDPVRCFQGEHRLRGGRRLAVPICSGILTLLLAALFSLAIGYLISWAATAPTKTVEYSVGINAVHGLDPATELIREHTVNTEFDLTLSIKAYQELVGGQCYQPGTTVEVTYRGVLLASAPIDKLCADEGQTREQHVVAWGTGVRLPGFALDALVADARNGAEAFDVMVKMPSKHSGPRHVMGRLVTCKGRRVGDATAAALWTPCDVSRTDITVTSGNTGKTQTGDAGAMEMEAASSADRRGCCSDVDVRQRICFGIFILVVSVLVAVFFGFLIKLGASVHTKTVEYSVGINAVHGLDPATELIREHAVNPEFDLSLSVKAYQELVGGQCYDPGTTVEVTYRGVLLASAPVDELCADVGQTREQHVVAWGTGVRLPEFALDALVADARNGADQAFDVAVKMPSKHSHYYYEDVMGILITCKGRRVGDATAAALWTPCDMSSLDIPVPSGNTGKMQTGDGPAATSTTQIWAAACVVLAVLCLIAFGSTAIVLSSRGPVYSASIDAVSGLDLGPAKDGQAPTLDPVFNLTIRISNRRQISTDKDCLDPGTTVEVTYRNILLASGPVEFCAKAGKTVDQPVNVWGSGVHLPGFALDALTAEARRGKEAFDVTVKVPNGESLHHHLISRLSCKARRVGVDRDATLRIPCQVDTIDVDLKSTENNMGTTQPGGARAKELKRYGLRKDQPVPMRTMTVKSRTPLRNPKT
uniref:Late embryogenesis abundant protein LEA-2 subgroup domain-containing protein n=1 Tax=Leersia perrieri TaxID=77586 RepID=A0A0D9VID9_9ORYZ